MVDQIYFSLAAKRRQELVQLIKNKNPQLSQGLILILAGIEHSRTVFRQESSFYYLTGITEPGAALVLDLDGNATLYVPNFGSNRAQWVSSSLDLTAPDAAKKLGYERIENLGELCVGYQFHPFFPKNEYKNLLERLEEMVKVQGSIFTLYPQNPRQYMEQRMLLRHMSDFVPGFLDCLVDISPALAAMRRIKDRHEIELLYKAINITGQAQEAAARMIEAGALECEVQAALEYIFTGSCARIAFPSIVAGGKNATILHYHENNQPLEKGGLVVVDIGAEYGYYCADITRTYPISGKFTKRQQEIYSAVLDTQTYIAELAKPGMYLNNKHNPEQSLHHLAVKFLQEHGYDKYFLHGIGHYLGLDVHDVGDYATPLQEGDVITIEPGIYSADEQIGVRIEDDYWLVKDGVVCLSEAIPKEIALIQEMAQEKP